MILDQSPPPADVRLRYGPDPLHFGDLRLPHGAGPHPLAIVIHGGFWRARYNLAHIGHLCADLVAAGIATWNVEYRRTGNEGGGWPGTFLDVARAADFVRQLARAYPLDPERVVTLGHSAGGHLALWLAARHRIPPGDLLHIPDPFHPRAALSLAGVADLRRAWELGLSDDATGLLMGGAPSEHPSRYATASPIELLPLGLPQVLIHGTADDNVPFDISRRYHNAAQSKGDDATLIPLPHAGHFEVIDPRSDEWPVILAAILEELAG